MKPTAGDFERLAIEQMDMLHRLARRLAGDPSRADDLVQETYLRAFRARERFELESFGIRPWLIRILRNVFLSRGERESRQPVALDDEALDHSGAAGGVEALPLSPGSWEGFDDRLVQALDALPGDYSAPLLLWAIEEMTYKEIAESLEIPIGTVMSRLHRARQKLGEALKDLAVERRLARE